MKNKKTIRLLAATWLIAPSVLSTNTVFAVDNQIADQTVTTDTTTSSSATSETTDSFTEDPTGTTTQQQDRPSQLKLIRLIHQKMKSQPRHIPLQLLLL